MGLLSGITGALGLGGDGPSLPSGLTQGVDPETHKAIENFRQDSLKGSKDLQKEMSAGVFNDPAFLSKKAGFEGQAGVGVDSKSLMDAIELRARGEQNRSNKRLKSDIQRQALESRFSRLLNAAELTSQEHKQNMQAEMNRYMAKVNRRNARASVLGNVLGIAGAAAGMGAGPMGAMAGYNIGQGLGQSFGG